MVNKKGAIELSMTTVVVIVLAMSMLILGLVLIRSIFKGATESVNILNDKVKGEITNLFSEESGGLFAIKLGADKVARVPIGTQSFGVGLGARTKNGESATTVGTVDHSHSYRISLGSETGDCSSQSLSIAFADTPGSTTWVKFNEFESDK